MQTRKVGMHRDRNEGLPSKVSHAHESSTLWAWVGFSSCQPVEVQGLEHTFILMVHFAFAYQQMLHCVTGMTTEDSSCTRVTPAATTVAGGRLPLARTSRLRRICSSRTTKMTSRLRMPSSLSRRQGPACSRSSSSSSVSLQTLLALSEA